MADIFISYAREDASTAQRLAAALEARGWSVFWDRRIPTGRRFDDYIAEQMGNTRCVVVLWSAAAIASEWVVEEAAEGRNRNILAPALIETVKAPPFGFRHRQAADLVGWQGEDAHEGFKRLMADVAALLGPPAEPANEEPGRGEPKDEPEAGTVEKQTRRADEEAGGKAAERQSTKQPSLSMRMIPRGRARIWVLAAVGLLLLAGLGWLSFPLPQDRTVPEQVKGEPAGSSGLGADKKEIGQKSGPEPGAAPMRKVIKAQIGYLSIPDLSATDVIYVFDQRSGQQVGNIQRGTKLPVPPGTYKVKFGDLYWTDVQVPVGEKRLQVGFIGIPDLSATDVIYVFDQRSGQQVGNIQRGKKLPVPPGTYNVKFGNISQAIEVEAGQEVEISK